MKKILILTMLTTAFFASCSNDDCTLTDTDGNNGKFISPKVRATVNTTDNSQSPMTGILEIYPCNPGTSIYYGNYVNDLLTPLPGYYKIENGDVYPTLNRPISLPAGTYTMIYWGTPKYEEPIYSNPTIMDPQITIGGDLSQQYFAMRKNPSDTTYYPVFDLVYAIKPANIGSEELSAAMKRQVAGLKVIVKNRNNGILSAGIAGMDVHIGGIAEKINVYSATLANQNKTVAFPLALSADGTQMSNATVMLFPSAAQPLFQLIITLKNGTVKTFRQTLSAPLKANSKLTLTLTLGDIFSEENPGNFTIDNWQEESETIDVPVLN